MKKNGRLQFCIKILAFFLMMVPVQAAFGQSSRITLNLHQEPLSVIFRAIEEQTGLTFFFNNNSIDTDMLASVRADNEELSSVLNRLLAPRYKCEISGSRIAITNADIQSNEQQPPQNKRYVLKGRVVDSNSKPLAGVTLTIKGTKEGGVTDKDGNYMIELPARSVIVVTCVGMKTQEINYTGQQELVIKLTETKQEIEEVIVTGIFTRKKESFTGSAATYTAQELKTMGTTNILQSLKTLDPSFAVLEDNQWGSDPNRLPNMEIRGKSSMLGVRDALDADPNQPLFILNGLESTLAAINDLDINRVASITILKDAASTAIYGSKAANGVVVVETVKPEPGKLQVNYNGSVNISMPDLSSYNLMNSAEKLQFDVLSGRFISDRVRYDVLYHESYTQKLRNVTEGVDSYWLAEPLRVGVNQNHSLYVHGGEGDFLFGLGGGYNGTTGVMKQSMRQVVNGNIDLNYRVSNFQFSNYFTFSRTKLTNPVVDFVTYAMANPYYKKYNEDGMIGKWLEYNDIFKAANPLYNASLNSRNEGKNILLSNFFITEYMPNQWLKLRARFGLTYGDNETENFISRDDTRFDNTESIKKGSFSATDLHTDRYEGELTVTYGRAFGEHQINLVLGGNVYSSQMLTQGYSVEGFPEGNFTYPSFSNGYPENGIPLYYESISRSINGYFNTGYAYNNRYLMDFSFRVSGSSIFGTTNKYDTTWSVGLGWNLHREKFIYENIPWIDQLKLRASVGNPGNQSFDSARTLLTYAFQYGSLNYFGLGALLNQVGNPDLEWQITRDHNFGIDITLFDKRLNIVADYYYKITDPLLINIGMPYSSGVGNYLTNVGEQIGQGFILSASYFFIRDFDRRFSWMMNGSLRTQKNRIEKIGNKLAGLNSSGKGTNTRRFYDGADPDDIWAVRSMGIDPSNGKELFLDAEGNYTYDFSYDNEVICGNSRPDLEGILGSSLIWRGFSLKVNFRYQIGADVFNTALYNKVENITDLNVNQDKRALYERWQKPGDKVRFKDIASSVYTPMSSRFVQRENILTLESVYLGYELYEGWVEKLGLSSLRLHVSMRDIFRSSTIRAEKGINYPFARYVDMGISFNF